MYRLAQALLFLLGAGVSAFAADNMRRFVEELGRPRAAAYLRMKRPAAIMEEERARVLAEMPTQGHIAPSEKARAKLAQLTPVLAFFGRDSIVEIRVVPLPYACIAFHERTVLIVAEIVLEILDAGQLQAVIAHELGHEYFWEEYQAARRQEDWSTLRAIEHLADGIATVALESLAVDPRRLSSAISSINRFNARIGPPPNPEAYPTENQRRRFIDGLLSHHAGNSSGVPKTTIMAQE